MESQTDELTETQISGYSPIACIAGLFKQSPIVHPVFESCVAWAHSRVRGKLRIDDNTTERKSDQSREVIEIHTLQTYYISAT